MIVFAFRILYDIQRREYLEDVEKYCTTGQPTDDNIIRLMRFACWTPKATDTHSEYVIIIAFPLRQQVDEHASLLGTLPVLS